MSSVQDLADAFHAAVMRSLAVKAFAPRDTALLAAATADEDDARGRLYVAAKLAHSINAASTISLSTGEDAIDCYYLFRIRSGGGCSMRLSRNLPRNTIHKL